MKPACLTILASIRLLPSQSCLCRRAKKHVSMPFLPNKTTAQETDLQLFYIYLKIKMIPFGFQKVPF